VTFESVAVSSGRLPSPPAWQNVESNAKGRGHQEDMAISFSKLAALNLFTFDISSGCFWQLSRSLVTGGGRRNLNHFVLQREFPWALKHVKPLWSPYPYGTSEPEVMYLELDIQD